MSLEDISAEIRNLKNTARGLRERATISEKEAQECDARVQALEAELAKANQPAAPAPAQ